VRIKELEAHSTANRGASDPTEYSTYAVLGRDFTAIVKGGSQ